MDYPTELRAAAVAAIKELKGWRSDGNFIVMGPPHLPAYRDYTVLTQPGRLLTMLDEHTKKIELAKAALHWLFATEDDLMYREFATAAIALLDAAPDVNLDELFKQQKEELR